MPQPKPLLVAAELVLNASLRRAFEQGELQPELIDPLLEAADLEGVPLDKTTLEYALRKSIEQMADRLLQNPSNVGLFQRLEIALAFLDALPFEVNLWKVQNTFYELFETVYADYNKNAERGDAQNRKWITRFRELGEKLSIRID
jgi:hypothetical protein